MEKVDVRGLSCPMPVLKCKKAIDSGAKEILVTYQSKYLKENVTNWPKEGFEVTPQ